MPTRFAPKRTYSDAFLQRYATCPQAGAAANDNGGLENSDMLLHAALRHFAEHGLSAAREARAQAENAFFAGDRQAYDWWLAICRTLDRRIAAELDYEFDHKLAPAV